MFEVFGLNYDAVFQDGGPNYILIKLMLFHLYVFLVIMVLLFDRLPVK